MKTQMSLHRAACRAAKTSSTVANSKQRPGLNGRLKSHRKGPPGAGRRKRSQCADLAEQSCSPATLGEPRASARPGDPNPQPTPANASSPAGKSSDALSAGTTPPIESRPSGEPVAEKEGEKNHAASPLGFGAPYGYFREGEAYPDPFPYEPPTEAEATALKLTPAQRIALEKITLGNQLSVAARAAGVTRMTLYRWLHHDPNFQAAYNTWQMDAIVNSRARIIAITNTATTTLELAVQTDPRMALALLRCVGIMQQVHQVPTEPEECKREIDRLERQAQSQFAGAMPPPPPEAPAAQIERISDEPSLKIQTNVQKPVEMLVNRKETEGLPSAILHSPALTSPPMQPIALASDPEASTLPQSSSTESAAAKDAHSSEENVAGHANPESDGAARVPQDVTFCNFAPLGHGLDEAGKVEALCRSDLP